jgi:hypothetical protein
VWTDRRQQWGSPFAFRNSNLFSGLSANKSDTCKFGTLNYYARQSPEVVATCHVYVLFIASSIIHKYTIIVPLSKVVVHQLVLSCSEGSVSNPGLGTGCLDLRLSWHTAVSQEICIQLGHDHIITHPFLFIYYSLVIQR